MEPQATSDEPQEQRYANAIAYRWDKINESRKSAIDELISDIPHGKDLIVSLGEIAQSLATLNVPATLISLPKLVLSATGVYAAVPNVRAILHEKKFHKEKLASTFRLLCGQKRRQDSSSLDYVEGLEFEVPDQMPETFLDSDEIRKVRHYLDRSTLNRVMYRLRHPSKKTCIAAARCVAGYGWEKVKDVALNLLAPERRNNILKGGMAGLSLAYRYHFQEKPQIRETVQLKTIAEKLQEAHAKGEILDAISFRERYITLAELQPQDIAALDRKTLHTRQVAKEFQTAVHGVTWNGIFIGASLGLSLYHIAQADFGAALMQWGSASIAANPFRFVGQQAKELYEVLHSRLAEEALEQSKIISERAHLDSQTAEPPAPENT